MTTQFNRFRAYVFPIILMLSIVFGGLFGYYFGKSAKYLKPFGDIFLNLIFTIIVPLIFFSVSSAIARIGSPRKLGKIFTSMAIVFIFTGLVASVLAIVMVQIFPPAQDVYISLPMQAQGPTVGFFESLAGMFTVSDFSKLLSHEHMLALIIFSIFVGLAACTRTDEQGSAFVAWLKSGEAVFMHIFSLIMYYAPIGFFAYFSVLVSDLGPTIVHSYCRVLMIYCSLALIYFICAYSGYAYLAGKKEGVIVFWKNIFLPMVTAIATCSSAASIPANMAATKAMRVSSSIYETAVPLGSILHKDGSVIGGVVKIAFLFGVFHLSFSGVSVLLTALGVSLLVGTVMGAIPSGGMLGELLILTVYGFPPSALIAIAAISIIIDPLATMLNVTGNSVSNMMIARLVDGKKWINS